MRYFLDGYRDQFDEEGEDWTPVVYRRGRLQQPRRQPLDYCEPEVTESSRLPPPGFYQQPRGGRPYTSLTGASQLLDGNFWYRSDDPQPRSQRTFSRGYAGRRQTSPPPSRPPCPADRYGESAGPRRGRGQQRYRQPRRPYGSTDRFYPGRDRYYQSPVQTRTYARATRPIQRPYGDRVGRFTRRGPPLSRLDAPRFNNNNNRRASFSRPGPVVNRSRGRNGRSVSSNFNNNTRDFNQRRRFQQQSKSTANRSQTVVSDDPDFTVKVRIVYKLLKASHHLHNVSGVDPPPMISKTTDSLATFIRPALPTQSTQALLESNARDWQKTAVQILQGHYEQVIDSEIQKLAEFSSRDWRGPLQVAVNWAKRNLGRRLRDRTVLDLEAFLKANLDSVTRTAPPVHTEAQTESPLPPPPPPKAKLMSVGTMTEQRGGDWSPFLPDSGGDHRSLRGGDKDDIPSSLPPPSSSPPPRLLSSSLSSSPLLPCSPPSPPSLVAPPVSLLPSSTLLPSSPPPPLVLPRPSSLPSLSGLAASKPHRASRSIRKKFRADPCTSHEILRISPAPADSGTEGLPARTVTPTLFRSKLVPSRRTSPAASEPLSSARLHQAQVHAPAYASAPTLIPTAPLGPTVSVDSQPESPILVLGTPPQQQPVQPTAGCTPTRRPTRHLNTSSKLKDWSLCIRKKHVIIGDSNLSRFPPFQNPDLQVDSYPGATFRHAESILHRTVATTAVETIILSFGVNSRHLKPRPTAIKQLQAALRAAKSSFPTATILIPILNFSSALPLQQQLNLQVLNTYITKHHDFIPHLPLREFKTEKDNIHWTHDTATRIFQHWVNYLN